jgi:RNA polymerase sigma-70 factor (ECF subfamily)
MEAMRDPESLALRPVLEAEINEALEELPDEFRLAVLLADVEELSYREIADIMGCPIGTVMSRLHRGRRLLKSRLYEHALAMGIVSPEPVVGNKDDAQKDDAQKDDAHKGDAPAPVDLNEYREKKGAVG